MTAPECAQNDYDSDQHVRIPLVSAWPLNIQQRRDLPYHVDWAQIKSHPFKWMTRWRQSVSELTDRFSVSLPEKVGFVIRSCAQYEMRRVNHIDRFSRCLSVTGRVWYLYRAAFWLKCRNIGSICTGGFESFWLLRKTAHDYHVRTLCAHEMTILIVNVCTM